MAQITLCAGTQGGERQQRTRVSYKQEFSEVHQSKIIIHKCHQCSGLNTGCEIYEYVSWLNVFKSWINTPVKHFVSSSGCIDRVKYSQWQCSEKSVLGCVHVSDCSYISVQNSAGIGYSSHTLIRRCPGIYYFSQTSVQRCVGINDSIHKSVQRCVGIDDSILKSVQRCVNIDDSIHTSVQRCVNIDDSIHTSVRRCVGTDEYSPTSVLPCVDTDEPSHTSVLRCAEIDNSSPTSVLRRVGIDEHSQASVVPCVGIEDFSQTSVQRCVGTDDHSYTSVLKRVSIDEPSLTLVSRCVGTDEHSPTSVLHIVGTDEHSQTSISDCAKSTHSTKTSQCSKVHHKKRFPPAKNAGLRRRSEIISLTALWFSYALLTITSTNSIANAAAVPSIPHFASPSSTNKRYTLVPASFNSRPMFLYFSPPTILNLRINTRQIVYFNFTLYPQQLRYGATNNITKTNTPKSNNTISNASNPSHDKSTGSSTATKTSTNSSKSKNTPYPTSSKSTISPSSSFTNSPSSSLKINSSGIAVTSSQRADFNVGIYWVMIYSNDETIARPLVTTPGRLGVVNTDANGSYILMGVVAGYQHNFIIEARHIGRVTMCVVVVNMEGDTKMPQSSFVHAVAVSEYPVTVIRGERTADIVFNSCAAIISIIISFGVGAVTDTDSLKKQLKYPVSLIVGFLSEFIVMPVMAFCLAMMLPLDKDMRFGLLCVACVPGGGLSHVAVIIADGDIALSLTMNLISVVAMLGTAPLWIFVLGQYFQADPHSVLNLGGIPIYNFEIWLVATFFAYAGGLAVKRLRPLIADAILMWLIKPFLLLASILYITLGVYINMYVFELVNGYALLGAMLLPLGGCILGGVLATICRQNYASIKTIALETSSLNCLVVMVALRFSLKQPDADLAAVVPIWVMFTIPGFFVFLAICNKVKNVILNFWRNRGNKDSDAQSSSKAYSISSSVVSPPGTTTLSAPLVTADGDDDATISSTSNQKVTVL